jgi:hypothetical protein
MEGRKSDIAARMRQLFQHCRPTKRCFPASKTMFLRNGLVSRPPMLPAPSYTSVRQFATVGG